MKTKYTVLNWVGAKQEQIEVLNTNSVLTLSPFSGGEMHSFQNSMRSASNSSLVLAAGMFSSGIHTTAFI